MKSSPRFIRPGDEEQVRRYSHRSEWFHDKEEEEKNPEKKRSLGLLLFQFVQPDYREIGFGSGPGEVIRSATFLY